MWAEPWTDQNSTFLLERGDQEHHSLLAILDATNPQPQRWEQRNIRISARNAQNSFASFPFPKIALLAGPWDSSQSTIPRIDLDPTQSVDCPAVNWALLFLTPGSLALPPFPPPELAPCLTQAGTRITFRVQALQGGQTAGHHPSAAAKVVSLLHIDRLLGDNMCFFLPL